MVNPAKLKSLVDQHATGPSAAQLGMAAPGGAAPDDVPYDDDMEDDEDGESPPKDPATRGAELIDEWGEFGETLKDEASELHDQAHDVGADLLLKDVPEDAIDDVGKAVDRMPDELSMGLAKYVSELPPEDVTALAAALCKEVGEDEADQNLLAAFLTQAGKYAADEVEVDDGFNEPDEDEEDDEDEEEEEEPEAAGGPGAGGDMNPNDMSGE